MTDRQDPTTNPMKRFDGAEEDGFLRETFQRLIVSPDIPTELRARLIETTVEPANSATARGPFGGVRVSSRAMAGLGVTAIVMALVAGSLYMRSNRPEASTQPPPSGSAPAPNLSPASSSYTTTVDSFGRVDASFTYAVLGATLYVSHDDGSTWQMHDLPDGLRPVFPVAFNGWGLLSTFVPKGQPLGGDQAGATSIGEWQATLYRSRDGGATWSQSLLPLTFATQPILQALDDQSAWVSVVPSLSMISGGFPGPSSSPPDVGPDRSVAEALLSTSDGGGTWQRVGGFGVAARPFFVSRTEAWAETTSGGLVHTQDGGVTWHTSGTMPVPAGYSRAWFADMAPLEISGRLTIRGVAGPANGDGDPVWLTWMSIDGGASWSIVSSAAFTSDQSVVPELPAIDLASVWTASHLVLETGGTADVAAADGKSTLGVKLSGLPGQLESLSASADGTILAAVGVVCASYPAAGSMDGSTNGLASNLCRYLYSTTDAGQHWRPILGAPTSPPGAQPASTPAKWTGPALYVNNFGQLGPQFAWAVSGDTLLATHDEGATWAANHMVIPPLGGSSRDAPLPVFTDPNHVFYVLPIATSPTTNRLVFYRSADGGRSWSWTPIPGYHSSWFTLDMLDAERGWLEVQTNNAAAQFLATTDGGQTWSVMGQLTTDLSSFEFLSPQEGWAFGDEHQPTARVRVFHTTDAGRTWTTGELPMPSYLANTNFFLASQSGPMASGNELRFILTDAPDSSAVGSPLPSHVIVWTSSDGGVTWNLSSTTPVSGGEPLLVGQTTGVGQFKRLLIAGLDGSLSAPYSMPSQPAQALPTTALAFEDGEAWVTMFDHGPTTGQSSTCGTLGCLGPLVLYGTLDGGKTWEPLLGTP
jgi:photosystem II stability/assembly factor-like uncharacterized protein